MHWFEIIFLCQGKDDYLGTVIARPSIILAAQSSLASLQWHAVSRFGEDVGELLAAFELIKVIIVHGDRYLGLMLFCV